MFPTLCLKFKCLVKRGLIERIVVNLMSSFLKKYIYYFLTFKAKYLIQVLYSTGISSFFVLFCFFAFLS